MEDGIVEKSALLEKFEEISQRRIVELLHDLPVSLGVNDLVVFLFLTPIREQEFKKRSGQNDDRLPVLHEVVHDQLVKIPL